MPTYELRCDVCRANEHVTMPNPPPDGAVCVTRVDPRDPMRPRADGCDGAMKRVWSAPAIGRGSSGEPFRGPS